MIGGFGRCGHPSHQENWRYVKRLHDFVKGYENEGVRVLRELRWRRKRDSLDLNPLIPRNLLIFKFARFAKCAPKEDFGCFDAQTRHSESPSGIFPFRNQFYTSWSPQVNVGDLTVASRGPEILQRCRVSFAPLFFGGLPLISDLEGESDHAFHSIDIDAG
jgi:hypothetical protein